MTNLTHKPFEVLANEEQDDKITRRHEMVDVDYIKRLYRNGMSFEQIGEAVGKSNTSISQYITAGSCPKTVDLAAKQIFNEKFGGKKPSASDGQMAIIQMELQHIKTIQSLVENLGGKFNFIKLD